MRNGGIVVEGMTELRANFRRLGGPDMVKELGQVHKRVGELVISRAGGASTGVGTGTGATIRPSATTREVQLRVGGRHRARFGKWRQWGIGQVWPPPSRPFLIGAAREAEGPIIEEYLRGVRAVAAPLRIEGR
jgi:hypothetical protein